MNANILHPSTCEITDAISGSTVSGKEKPSQDEDSIQIEDWWNEPVRYFFSIQVSPQYTLMTVRSSGPKASANAYSVNVAMLTAGNATVGLMCSLRPDAQP